MSFAGFDPSAGAGLLADIKTFEQHKVYGFGICTANTMQTDDTFSRVQWNATNEIIEQAIPLLEKFDVKTVKIGIVENLDTLQSIITTVIRIRPHVQFVWDPVLSASAGYNFHANFAQTKLQQSLQLIHLVTPNYNEALKLHPASNGEEAALGLAKHCAVLLKGGHHPTATGFDTLFYNNQVNVLPPLGNKASAKHGSGCVLSAAIVASLALGNDLFTACRLAKSYTYQILTSNNTLLGYHHG
ncbi:hydroxymethylpyrimidine/phosphomethylpyrimidine kinase [Chitinophaga skermanii]|uniref:hydroxymethylpyrimidine kinase n=2 Tax=Chitinophaga skermanii TaxID=331697 RepID=A0A327QB77_9BACT|nr:hydroxymethylpyrimidine/phosphomethylpyrimidine kinase [Chitinophaga skermanii]